MKKKLFHIDLCGDDDKEKLAKHFTNLGIHVVKEITPPEFELLESSSLLWQLSTANKWVQSIIIAFQSGAPIVVSFFTPWTIVRRQTGYSSVVQKTLLKLYEQCAIELTSKCIEIASIRFDCPNKLHAHRRIPVSSVTYYDIVEFNKTSMNTITKFIQQ